MHTRTDLMNFMIGVTASTAMERMKEAAKPEGQKLEEAWNRLKRDIASSAQTIHDIDTGKARGYSRALFVSSILNKVSTYAGKGEVEIVQKAVDFITDFNAQCKKPVITPRNRFFQLPEMATPGQTETSGNQKNGKTVN